MKIEMPTMLLPALSDKEGVALDAVNQVREELGVYFRFMHAYPKHTGVDGRRDLLVPMDGVDVRQPVDNMTKFDDALAYLDPEWTTIYHMWYNRWGAVKDVAAVAARRSQRLVVGCTGTNIVDDVPADVIIGYDNLHQRVSSEPQLPIEQLVGRDVCIVGGMPRRQFATFCELTVQGVNVVAVYWPASWYYNAMRTRVYWDVHLNTQQELSWSRGMLLMQGIKNALTWWVLGLRRMNRFLTSGPKTTAA